MTYNFDPDKWYEGELAYLEARMKSGKISKEEFNKALENLEQKYEDIWKRLDGTYEIDH